jgi:hypothetical protein
MRNSNGTFAKGNPGRPKGSRNKLSSEFINVLAEDFGKHGNAVVEKLRQENPTAYVNVIAKLVPAGLELSGPDGDNVPLSGVVRFIKPSDRQ